MELETFDRLTTDSFSQPREDIGTDDPVFIQDINDLDLLPLEESNFRDLSSFVQNLVDHYNEQIIALNFELEEIREELRILNDE